MAQTIPVALSVLVLLWASASAAVAFSGGQASGLHHIAPARERPRQQQQERSVEEHHQERSASGPPRAGRWNMFARIANYVVAIGVMGMLVIATIGVILWGVW